MAAMRSAIFQASFFLRTRSRLVQSTRARLLTRPPSARRDAPCPRGAPPHLSSPEEGHACRSHCARRGSTNLNVKIRSIPCAALREHRSDMRGLAPHVPSASTRTDQADPPLLVCAFGEHRGSPASSRPHYPCRCLCRGLLQRIRTTPRRRTTLHFAQIGLTDDLTFMRYPHSYLNRYVIRPRVRSYGDISTVTLSPGRMRMKCMRIFPEIWARIL
jgi:hypothetical protein